MISPYLLLIPIASANMHPITIHPDRTRQTIDNFGASDSWTVEPLIHWPEASRKRIAELLFDRKKGAGLTGWRFNIGGGIDHEAITHPLRTVDTYETAAGQYDWNRCPGQRWMLNAAKEYGVPDVIAYSITPPRRLTLNGHTNATDGKGTMNLKPGAEPEFAKYLADIVSHFREQGVPIRTISPINEPEWEWNGVSSQEGTRASQDDIMRVGDALHEELTRRNLPIRLLIPEAGTPEFVFKPSEDMSKKYKAPYGDYVDMLLKHPDWRERNKPILAYHAYWSDSLKSMVEMRQKLREALDKVPGQEAWQTEYCQMQGPSGEGGHGRDLGMTLALNVARLVHLDMTVSEASAWQWWLGVSDADYKDGLIYVDDLDKPDGTIYASKALWALGNFARFVRPGYRRVEVESGPPNLYGLQTSAYRSPDGKELAIVFVNCSTSSQDVPITLPGFRNGVPYITSDRPGDDLRRGGEASLDKPFRVPSRSVVTLVCHR